MTATHDGAIPLEDLVAYQTGELDAPAQDAVEEHLFGCDTCTRLLETVQQLGVGIQDLVRHGRFGGALTAQALARAGAEGVQVRTYTLGPGDTVHCTAAPGDELVVARLRLQRTGTEQPAEVEVEVALEDLDRGQTQHEVYERVPVDHAGDELLLVYGGDFIRSMPRSRWTITVRNPGEPDAIGDFVMDHTPWERLDPADRP